MKKKSILLVALLITIGFAAVSTTLIMNGVINITSNKEDFDVYFSEAILDNVDVSDTTISSDKKTINFSTKNLKNVGDTSVLDYEVTNNSTQYDASVQVNCTPNSGDYFTLTNSLKETIVAKTRENGKVTVELTKASINEQNINFTCTIDVIATEKTEANNGPIAGTCEYENGTEWKYEYTGDSQEFVTPCEGEYKLEVWGAGAELSNFGGYSSGVYKTPQDSTLYIYIGGKSVGTAGGYNGGGAGGTGGLGNGTGGGGATHIAISARGVLANYKNYKTDVLIVAGGAGGFGNGSSYPVQYRWEPRDQKGGAGGGETGGTAYPAYYHWVYGSYNGMNGAASTALNKVYFITGGTQTTGYEFGQGQNGGNVIGTIYDAASNNGHGGGGGGWYGGNASTLGPGAGKDTGGAGGSGYVSKILSETIMESGINQNDGYAKITLISSK